MQHKLVSLTHWFAVDPVRVRLAIIIALLVMLAIIAAIAPGSVAFAGEATAGSS